MTPQAQKSVADLLPKPVHTRVFTVSNQKGGVGKTSTAVNLAAALAEAGLNVLVIDNDPQGNASTALGIEHGVDVPSVYNVLIEDKPLSEIVQECPDMPGLFCAPANIDLAGAEIELVSLVARETRLKNALMDYTEWREKQGMERLDYVFIDCPPSLGLLTVNAFVAAEEILIPIQCEYYALEGLSQLLKNIQMIQKHLNSKLRTENLGVIELVHQGAGDTTATVVQAVIMIVLMSATQFYIQKQLSVKNMSEAALNSPMFRQQQMIMYIFPIIFAVSGINFPLGVMYYWTVSNLWSLGQQWWVIRNNPTPGSQAERELNARRAAKGLPPIGKTREQHEKDLQEARERAAAGQRQQPVGKKRQKQQRNKQNGKK